MFALVPPPELLPPLFPLIITLGLLEALGLTTFPELDVTLAVEDKFTIFPET